MEIFNLILIILLFNTVFSTSNVLGCGLVAASSPKGTTLNPMLIKMLMLYNERRGTDSSGFWPNSEGEVSKIVGTVSENLLPFTEVDDVSSNIFIGHTRAKTSGAATKDNAHPFKFEDGKNFIIGAHNGSLDNWEPLVDFYNYDGSIVDMDSKFIFYHRLKSKAKLNWQVFKDIGGPAAVILTEDNETLKIWRNKSKFNNDRQERPLYRGVIEVDGKPHMYISSLKNSLQAIGCNKIQEFKKEYLYTIKNGKVVGSPILVKNASKSSFDLKKEIREMRGVVEPTTTTTRTAKYTNGENNSRNINSFSRKEPFPKTGMRNNSQSHSASAGEDLQDYYNNEGSWATSNETFGGKEHNSRVDSLKALDDVSKDNYNSLDDSSDVPLLDAHIEQLTVTKLKSKLPKFGDYVASGMPVERAFLLMQNIASTLEVIAETMGDMTADEIGRESLDLENKLKEYSLNIKEQMLNLIENCN